MDVRNYTSLANGNRLRLKGRYLVNQQWVTQKSWFRYSSVIIVIIVTYLWGHEHSDIIIWSGSFSGFFHHFSVKCKHSEHWQKLVLKTLNKKIINTIMAPISSNFFKMLNLIYFSLLVFLVWVVVFRRAFNQRKRPQYSWPYFS